eukprot:6451927-Amphidinium_carterae.1
MLFAQFLGLGCGVSSAVVQEDNRLREIQGFENLRQAQQGQRRALRALVPFATVYGPDGGEDSETARRENSFHNSPVQQGMGSRRAIGAGIFGGQVYSVHDSGVTDATRGYTPRLCVQKACAQRLGEHGTYLRRGMMLRSFRYAPHERYENRDGSGLSH